MRSETIPRRGFTHAEHRALRALHFDGQLWVVPAQLAMVRRLQYRGLCRLTLRTRPNPLRGAIETEVLPGPRLPEIVEVSE